MIGRLTPVALAGGCLLGHRRSLAGGLRFHRVWQGRTTGTDQSARMGPCALLRQLRATDRCPQWLVASLQLALARARGDFPLDRLVRYGCRLRPVLGLCGSICACSVDHCTTRSIYARNISCRVCWRSPANSRRRRSAASIGYNPVRDDRVLHLSGGRAKSRHSTAPSPACH
jgi:hypothetical protein